MSTTPKKICILIAGGSVVQGASGTLIGVKKQEDIAPWLKSMPELGLVAKDLEIHLVHKGGDAELSPKTWLAAARFIYAKRSELMGVVVLASIDTIPYFARALFLMLKKIPFAIVFTGSQLPDYLLENNTGLDKLLAASTDVGLRANLVNAIQVLHQNFTGVFALFGGKLIAGDHIYVKESLSDMPLGYSSEQAIGKMEFSVKISEERQQKLAARASASEMILYDHIEERVKFFTITPTFNLLFDREKEFSAIAGAVFKIQSTVAYPLALREALAKRTPRIPVVFWGTSLMLPKAAESIPFIKELEEEGIIVVSGKGFAEVLVTFMWLLGKTTNREEIQQGLLL